MRTRKRTRREWIDFIIGGGFGFWLVIAFAFFVFAVFAPDLVQADFRVMGGFFCITWAMIAEARRSIINEINKQKEEDNGNS